MKTPQQIRNEVEKECFDLTHKEFYKYNKDSKLICSKCKKHVKIVGGMYYYVKR